MPVPELLHEAYRIKNDDITRAQRSCTNFGHGHGHGHENSRDRNDEEHGQLLFKEIKVKKIHSSLPVVAAFDFDGTITYHDTLFPFLKHIEGTVPAVRKLFSQLPFLLAYSFGIMTRQKTKEKILNKFLKGRHLDDLRSNGRQFARGPLKNLIRPESMERFQWHLSEGHRCILISAALEIYLRPWAEEVGFHDVIASHLETNTHGFVSGKLNGLNCWGSEKTRRLTELLGNKENYLLFAYGDSRGDKELLDLADFSYYRSIPMV